MVLVACALVLAGCARPLGGTGPYVPEVVGVVVSADLTEGNLTRYTLANGETFTFNQRDQNSYARVIVGGSGIGDLLLAGRLDNRPWLAIVPPADARNIDLPYDCSYWIVGRATDEGDSILLDYALKLPKAPGFDPGFIHAPGGGPQPASPGLRYDGIGQGFCLNEEGYATAAR